MAEGAGPVETAVACLVLLGVFLGVLALLPKISVLAALAKILLFGEAVDFGYDVGSELGGGGC
jgi:hypothetical protein